jgi:hypothetical protein
MFMPGPKRKKYNAANLGHWAKPRLSSKLENVQALRRIFGNCLFAVPTKLLLGCNIDTKAISFIKPQEKIKEAGELDVPAPGAPRRNLALPSPNFGTKSFGTPKTKTHPPLDVLDYSLTALAIV